MVKIWLGEYLTWPSVRKRIRVRVCRGRSILTWCTNHQNNMATIELSFLSQVFLSLCIVYVCVATHVHQFEVDLRHPTQSVEYKSPIRSRRDLADAACQRQESSFLQEVNSGKVKLEQKVCITRTRWHISVTEIPWNNMSAINFIRIWQPNNGDFGYITYNRDNSHDTVNRIYSSVISSLSCMKNSNENKGFSQ